MPINPNFASDMRYCFRIYEILSNIIGVWPISKQASRTRRLFNGLQICFTCFLFLFTLVPLILFSCFKVKAYADWIKMFGAFCFPCAISTQYVLLLLHRGDIEKCVEHIAEDWKRAVGINRQIMLARVKTSRTITMVCVIVCYSSGFAYRIILPFARSKTVIKGNVTVRPLVYASYFVIFDAQLSPAYEIVVFGRCLAAVVLYGTAICICGLTIFFVLHICGQLEILIDRLKNIANDDIMQPAADRRLALIVEHHKRTLLFLSTVQHIMRNIWIIAILSSVAILVGLQVHFVLGEKVYIMCCTVDWNRLPLSVARGMILITAMSKNPTKITAGKFIDLTLVSCSNIVKTLMGYMNVLLQFSS
ncbi:hypothetical protein KM043_005924 [Ampulex compressa]|nr:hypothetical protein KM043_005924 [Ampulex compressa]